MAFWCSSRSKAERRYQWRFTAVMICYLLTVFAVTALVRHSHPTGWNLYFLSALATWPVLSLVLVVGQYLREEEDEFKRMLLVRSMLVGIAATLVLSVYDDFLRSYGSHNSLPPFTLFVTFWLVMAFVQGIQSFTYRIRTND